MSDETEVVLKAYRQEKTIKIQLEEDGPVRDFKVITITGAEKGKWKDGQIKNTRVDANTGQPIGLKTFSRLEAGLIHICLRDDTGAAVPVETIDSWATPLIETLARICMEHNGLTKGSEEEKK